MTSDAPVTIVFAHGFTLSMDSFHFQRRDLGDVARLVFYDQRSHGASGDPRRRTARSTSSAGTSTPFFRRLPRLAPSILVGHSMGGMTILALADQHPELFGDRIVGVALLATSTGDFAKSLVRAARLGRAGGRSGRPACRKSGPQSCVVAREQPQARHRLRLHGDPLSVVRLGGAAVAGGVHGADVEQHLGRGHVGVLRHLPVARQARRARGAARHSGVGVLRRA